MCLIGVIVITICSIMLFIASLVHANQLIEFSKYEKECWDEAKRQGIIYEMTSESISGASNDYTCLCDVCISSSN